MARSHLQVRRVARGQDNRSEQPTVNAARLFPRPPRYGNRWIVSDSRTFARRVGEDGRMTDPEAVLEALDDEQRAVARALHGPVCVLAGAGTGKTRAITHRIAYGVLGNVFAPSQVLAVTFTVRAAGEMRGRLRDLGVGGVQARTFHSAALRQLHYFWPKVVGGEPPTLVERKLGLIAEAAARVRVRAERTDLRDLAGEIEWAKVSQAAPDDYLDAATKAGRVPPRDPAEIRAVYATYDQLKRDRGMIDFEDVLLLTVGVLEDRPDVADTVRSQYRHFVVDEYQDVNPLQQRLLERWLGDRDSVCVVGDASQTIYSFTGATPSYLLRFPDRYPNSTVVRLVRDYRSTTQVVALANALLAKASGVAARARLELVAQRGTGPEPEFDEYADEPAEADAVARRIRRMLDGTDGPADARRPPLRASDIAVLFRTNAQSEAFEQALAEVGVPYLLRGAERFFDRPEVRQAALLLRGAARAGGKDDGAGDAPGLPAAVRGVLSSNGWTPEPPRAGGATRDQWESLAALAALADDFAAANPDAGLAEFSAELEARAAVQHAPTVEGVTLASLHAAKGLEWEAVFIVGLTEGLLPISFAETDEQIEEERRLLYVGVTRARSRLLLSSALARTPGARPSRRVSRFLDGLRGSARSAGSASSGGVLRYGTRQPTAAGDGGSRRQRATGPVRCRVCGKSLIEAVERKLGRCADCPSDLDEALFERLRAWRKDRAAQQSLPAYCVFTDATLTAIAERRPADLAALAEISGVGQAKLDRYGADVLTLCSGGDVPLTSMDTATETQT
jgi:DNA helicase-2/ATP-dependent DNA helicase PcrA